MPKLEGGSFGTLRPLGLPFRRFHHEFSTPNNLEGTHLLRQLIEATASIQALQNVRNIDDLSVEGFGTGWHQQLRDMPPKFNSSNFGRVMNHLLVP